jgi:hypothetical protein
MKQPTVNARDLNPDSIVRMEKVPLTKDTVVHVRMVDGTWAALVQFKEDEKDGFENFMQKLAAFSKTAYGIGATDAANAIMQGTQFVSSAQGRAANIELLRAMQSVIDGSLSTPESAEVIKKFIEFSRNYQLANGVL